MRLRVGAACGASARPRSTAECQKTPSGRLAKKGQVEDGWMKRRPAAFPLFESQAFENRQTHRLVVGTPAPRLRERP